MRRRRNRDFSTVVTPRIARIVKKFERDTQKTREELIVSLQALMEEIRDRIASEKNEKAKMKLVKQAANIALTINRILGEYGDKKIMERLEKLEQMVGQLKREEHGQDL